MATAYSTSSFAPAPQGVRLSRALCARNRRILGIWSRGIGRDFLPGSVRRHLYDEVGVANRRRGRYMKEEALASFALDVDEGTRKSIREYARIWRVPRGTAEDWMPHCREMCIELSMRWEGVDKGQDFLTSRAHPDTPPDRTVESSRREIARTPKRRHWKGVFHIFRERIQTHTKKLISLVVNRACGKVDNQSAQAIWRGDFKGAAVYTYKEALECYRSMCGGLTRSLTDLFRPVRGEKGTRFMPTDECLRMRRSLQSAPQGT